MFHVFTMSLILSKDFKELNDSTLCKLWCTWLYILNKPFDHLHVDMDISSDTIVKYNSIFWI